MNNITLAKINLHAPTQLRLMENQQHIEDLAHDFIEAGSFQELPWVAFVKETNEYVPIDGFHRLMAIEWLSKQDDIEHNVNTEEVAIRYSEFDTLAEAIIAAAGVNATHGLKRQKGDIQNAIRTLLEVDRIRFMESKYKLNKKVIMDTVKCSSVTYTKETKTIRNELEAARNIAIDTLALEGLSQREIAQRVGCDQKTVSNILREEKVHDVNFPQDEGEENTHDAQIPQGEGEEKVHDVNFPQEDDQEPSVFNHITTATVADNPWDEVEAESSNGTGPSKSSPTSSQVEPNALGEQSPCTLKAELTDDELCELVMGLDDRQQDLLRNLLNNM
jgi:hypothetical protein